MTYFDPTTVNCIDALEYNKIITSKSIILISGRVMDFSLQLYTIRGIVGLYRKYLSHTCYDLSLEQKDYFYVASNRQCFDGISTVDLRLVHQEDLFLYQTHPLNQ